MLRISKKADYAVFLLGAIARQGAYPGGPAGDAVVSAHEIARQAKLNKSVVANLLKEFAKSGLLDSTRGLKGGYRLGRAPSAISLGDILEVVEGKFVLVDCVAHGHSGSGHSGSGHSGSGQANASQPANLKPTELLALAPSMRRPDTAPSTDPDVPECALISFCPSQHPMRIVHRRIAELFHTIRLDELCALAPLGGTPKSAPKLTLEPGRR
jgi:Rrf2 family protein